MKGNFRISEWNKEDYSRLVIYLQERQDISYRNFHQKLVPDVSNLIGIRVPILREVAMEISSGNIHSFLYQAKHTSYEETLLQGMVINQIKVKKETNDINQLLRYVKEFVPYINNWAICDVFCGGMKVFKKNKEETYEFLKPYFKSEQEYDLRFAIVVLLDFFVEEAYLEDIFTICDEILVDYHYVKMAIAWLLSVCFVKYEDQTLYYLQNNKLDQVTYNKTLQKILESNRVAKDKKKVIRSMKR